MASLLRSFGCVVQCAGDGLEALEAIGAGVPRYDLVITDHDMPRMTGLELIEKLEELNFPGRIILNSATLKFEELIPHEHRGFVTLLGKPVSPDILLETLVGLGFNVVEECELGSPATMRITRAMA